MTAEEFDTALTDLETRVDRLRALYENWFRGYEKTEPGVARKDVERRVYGLRKELPRNTALRFRYHQLYQRYTTLATYWARTARQIEEGTYRRQLQRLKRRRDDEQARTLAPPPRAEESSAPPAAFELNLDETLDVRNLLDDFDLDQVASALEGTKAESEKPLKELAAHVRAGSRMSVPDAAALGALASGTASADAAPRTVGRFARPSASADAAPGMRPSAPTPANDVTPRAVTTPPAVDKPAAAKPVAVPPSAPQAKPPAVAAPPVAKPPAVAAPAAPSAPSAAKPAVPAPPKPPALPTAARGPAGVPPPPPARGTGTVPMPPAPSGRGTGTVPMPPPPSAARPAPPARPPQISGTVARADAGAAAPKGEGLDEQRMRRIYEEYAAAKRKNNEGEVRYETLAGSIQKMLPDLTKKHAGKQIDFEIVMKDGRVGLKPKAT